MKLSWPKVLHGQCAKRFYFFFYMFFTPKLPVSIWVDVFEVLVQREIKSISCIKIVIVNRPMAMSCVVYRLSVAFDFMFPAMHAHTPRCAHQFPIVLRARFYSSPFFPFLFFSYSLSIHANTTPVHVFVFVHRRHRTFASPFLNVNKLGVAVIRLRTFVYFPLQANRIRVDANQLE